MALFGIFKLLVHTEYFHNLDQLLLLISISRICFWFNFFQKFLLIPRTAKINVNFCAFSKVLFGFFDSFAKSSVFPTRRMKCLTFQSYQKIRYCYFDFQNLFLVSCHRKFLSFFQNRQKIWYLLRFFKNVNSLANS